MEVKITLGPAQDAENGPRAPPPGQNHPNKHKNPLNCENVQNMKKFDFVSSEGRCGVNYDGGAWRRCAAAAAVPRTRSGRGHGRAAAAAVAAAAAHGYTLLIALVPVLALVQLPGRPGPAVRLLGQPFYFE